MDRGEIFDRAIIITALLLIVSAFGLWYFPNQEVRSLNQTNELIEANDISNGDTIKVNGIIDTFIFNIPRYEDIDLILFNLIRSSSDSDILFIFSYNGSQNFKEGDHVIIEGKLTFEYDKNAEIKWYLVEIIELHELSELDGSIFYGNLGFALFLFGIAIILSSGARDIYRVMILNRNRDIAYKIKSPAKDVDLSNRIDRIRWYQYGLLGISCVLFLMLSPWYFSVIEGTNPNTSPYLIMLLSIELLIPVFLIYGILQYETEALAIREGIIKFRNEYYLLLKKGDLDPREELDIIPIVEGKKIDKN